jgi:hypothetical protein
MTPDQAIHKYHWIKYNPETNEIDMFCDHQMLSTLRQCESKFQLEHILNIRPRGHKAWNLVFGAWLHYCIEVYYNSIKNDPDGKPLNVLDFTAYARSKWEEMNLEAYKDEPKYEDVGGWNGALALIIEYYAYYMEQRMRVVACEIPFGFEKEVFLGKFRLPLPINERHEVTSLDYIKVNCFLTGRIDMLADNGSLIGPVDHKHTHIFRGDEYDKFNPHDGLTGYIYATNAIIKKYFPDYKNSCSTGWIYHIQGKAPSVERKTKILRPRFKGSRVDKTPSQMREYADRQITSFKRIASMLFQDEIPQWATNACSNMYGRVCEYREIHRQSSEYWPKTVETYYHITEAWNPLKPEESLIARDDVMNAMKSEAVAVQEE